MNVFLNSVVKLYELLNTGSSINESLQYIFDSFHKYIPYNRIGVALLNSDGNIEAHATCADNPTVLGKGYSLGLLYSSLNSLTESKEFRIINNYSEYLSIHPDSEPTKLIIQEGLMSSLTCPLVVNGLVVGFIFFSSKNQDSYTEGHAAMAKIIANNMAIVIEKNLLVDDLILTSITGFTKLVEKKDNDTGMHVERMQNYSKIIAQSLAKSEKYKNIITNQFIEDIFKFSPLHDIGKVGIADNILLKPGKLTVEEFEEMKKHTVIGADALRKASNNLLRNGRHFFDIAIQIAESHHEKYNGKGYPHGLSGDDIPLSARIVTVGDVFDALSSKRVYKCAYDIETSMLIILNESGISFDPDVVAALQESLEEILQIYNHYQENQ